jgi:curli biogenesis system outer membrane secretion channel CsgG
MPGNYSTRLTNVLLNGYAATVHKDTQFQTFSTTGFFMKLRRLPLALFCASASIFASNGPCFAQNATAVVFEQPSGKALKTKIAIGRFSNETRYGASLLRDDNFDPLGKQAADILSAYLVKTGKFLVLERSDLGKIENEQMQAGQPKSVVGADTLIIGSVVEFGRTEDGKRGLLNKERIQRAHAKVAIRLVDVRTGLAYFSATGQGEATTDTKTVLGIGSTSSYDGTLTDKALSVAVEDMLERLVNSLSARKWRTDVLSVDGSQIYISGGQHQGLNVGDKLSVVRPGRIIKSAQTGFDIQLPSTSVGTLQVVSLFGETETNEGAITQLVAGSIAGLDPQSLMVVAN